MIGKSGSGKSTLTQLLMRFYLPTSGEILIDGNPMQTLNINWIRNNISLLEQRIVLFNESVITNIAFGCRNHEAVRRVDVEKSIEFAMLQNTIHGLPQGGDTCVGPGGSFLSGGQRQRVAIARAQLRDTPILILDEPTNALDHKNCVAVMKALREWRKGKTTIIITHDMSQILDQDYLYILEHGSIVQSGFRHEVERLPGSEKYFHSAKKNGMGEGKSISTPVEKESHSIWDSSSLESLEDLQPAIPQRVRQNRRESWGQHQIPPGFRSSTWEIAGKRHAIYSAQSEESTQHASHDRSVSLSFVDVSKPEPSQDGPNDYISMPAEGV